MITKKIPSASSDQNKPKTLFPLHYVTILFRQEGKGFKTRI